MKFLKYREVQIKKKISDWIVEFAKERNLEVVQDKAFNVFIRKPATAGYEEYSPLILQGHMDMVWEKIKIHSLILKLKELNLL